MRIFHYFIIFLLILYWSITFTYNLPNNPIKIQFNKEFTLFGSLFQQKWDFFAPPPQANHKLYFTYYDTNKSKIATYEVLTPIIKEKQKKSPFNTNSEAMDYIISSSFTNALNLIVYKNKEFKFLYKDKDTKEVYKMAVDYILKNIDKYDDFKTLINFSEVIKNKNIKHTIPVKYIAMTMTEIKINKFANRNSKARIENLLLETNLIKV